MPANRITDYAAEADRLIAEAEARCEPIPAPTQDRIDWRRRAEVAEADAAMLAALLEASYAANRACWWVLAAMSAASVVAAGAMGYACWILSG